jgi:hemoglobin
MAQAEIPQIPTVRPAGETAAESGPYASSPVFDQTHLPAALRRAHATKAGVWAVIRVLEGQVRYRIETEDHDVMLSPDVPGLVRPQEPHHVEALGAVRMQVEFYDHLPAMWS